MSYDVVTGEFCASYYGTFEVLGSHPGTSYTVTLSGADGPHCTCPAFAFSGEKADCKHIRQVRKEACLWSDQRNEGNQPVLLLAGRISYCPDGIPGLNCPNCGGPVVPVKIAV